MSATRTRPGVQAPVESLAVSAFTVPTDEPESDGTAEWESTTIVVVEDKRVRGRLVSPKGCRDIEQLLAPWLR